MNKILLSLLLIAFFCQTGIAQKKKAWIKAADRAFDVEQDYYKAFKYYESALKYKEADDLFRLLYRKAESARLIGAAQDALDAYQRLLAEAPEDTLARQPYNDIRARMGDVQLSLAYTQGDFSHQGYDLAAGSFEQHQSKGYKSLTGAEALEKGMAVINFVNQDQDQFANTFISLDSAFYDPNLPDYSSSVWPWANPEVTGTRRGTRYAPQFYLSGKDGQYYGATSASQSMPACMNTYMHHAAFNKDRNRVYFTVCDETSETAANQCNIFFQGLDARGLPAGEMQEIPELRAGDPAFIQIQPAIGWDESRGREVLYFVSNRPGGRGGMDIWKSEYDPENGRFLAPVNETSVNTTGDEMTPFYQNKTLYFSSNGRADRYGGFDIYHWNAQSQESRNLGQKINSSADDFGYSRDTSGNRAFFITNRQSVSSPSEAVENRCAMPDIDGCCCLNTFSYAVPDCSLEVVTLSHCNCPTGEDCQPLSGPVVKLYDITNGADYSGQAGITVPAREENLYVLENALEPGRKYQLVGVYENGATSLEAWGKILDYTQGEEPCGDGAPERDSLRFACDQPYLSVEVFAENGDRLPSANVRILDITGRQGPVNAVDGPPSGDPCVSNSILDIPMPEATLIQAFTQQEIAFNRTYLLEVSTGEPGLLPKRDTFTLADDDVAFCGLDCVKELQVVLESKTSVQPPPGIQFFFDNARPRWQGWPNRNRDQDIAIQSYLEALADYRNLKTTYANNFSSGSAEDDNQKLELEIFFTNELMQSEQKLYDFVKNVQQLLCQGVPVTLQAKGCTSPKFKLPGEEVQINFNNHLENRRVESVKRDLEKLGLKPGEWDQLYNFQQVYEPCEQYLSNPSVDLKDLQDQNQPKYSVFSIDAAVARRVEIEVIIGSQ